MSTLVDLPNELLLEIFRYIDLFELILSISLVNNQFRLLVDETLRFPFKLRWSAYTFSEKVRAFKRTQYTTQDKKIAPLKASSGRLSSRRRRLGRDTGRPSKLDELRGGGGGPPEMEEIVNKDRILRYHHVFYNLEIIHRFDDGRDSTIDDVVFTRPRGAGGGAQCDTMLRDSPIRNDNVSSPPLESINLLGVRKDGRPTTVVIERETDGSDRGVTVLQMAEALVAKVNGARGEDGQVEDLLRYKNGEMGERVKLNDVFHYLW